MNLRPRLIGAIALAATFAQGASATAIEPTGDIGIGLPELIHVRVGAFVNPRLSVELYASNVIFNWLTGITATGYVLGKVEAGQTPVHTVPIQVSLAFNPLSQPLTIRGGGEKIGAGALIESGYALTTRGGFMFSATAGVIFYMESSLAAGPLFSVSAGWKF